MALGHALEDVLEVGERLHIVEFCRGDEGTDGRPSLSATVGAGEQMVLAAQCDGSDRAFDGIVVELELRLSALRVPHPKTFTSPKNSHEHHVSTELRNAEARESSPGGHPHTRRTLCQQIAARIANAGRRDMRLPLGIAFLTLAAVETAAGPDDDYYNCTAIAVRKLDDGTSDARSIAAAVVGICRK
jgi:hypothetical protein